MTQVLVVATGNPGKISELTEALKGSEYRVQSSQELQDQTPVAETGQTFEENARIKAEAYSLRTPNFVVADDSGLEVDAMDGRPGVLSARYGSPMLSDVARCKAILKALIDTPDPQRTARFRCVLAVARGGKTIATFDGFVEGTILRELRGSNGFGYDPIFFHPPSGKAFGELTREEKERVSHRGQALRKLVDAAQRGALS